LELQLHPLQPGPQVAAVAWRCDAILNAMLALALFFLLSHPEPYQMPYLDHDLRQSPDSAP
jgi:hypothetical protein